MAATAIWTLLGEKRVLATTDTLHYALEHKPEFKGIKHFANRRIMTKFAVQYSFGVLHPYILAQSLSEPPPRPKNELLQPTLGFVPYGADLSHSRL